MPFRPGETGNPAGRAKGSRNRVTGARQRMSRLIEREGLAVMKVAVKMAKEGDTTCIGIVAARFLPPLKPMQAAVPLPLNPDLDDATNRKALIGAMGAGDLDAHTGATLLDALKLGPAAGGLLSIVIDLGPLALPAPAHVIENGEGA